MVDTPTGDVQVRPIYVIDLVIIVLALYVFVILIPRQLWGRLMARNRDKDTKAA